MGACACRPCKICRLHNRFRGRFGVAEREGSPPDGIRRDPHHGRPCGSPFPGKNAQPQPRTGAVIRPVNVEGRRTRGGAVIKSGHPDIASARNGTMNWHRIFGLLHSEMASGFVATSLTRLLLAAILGGAIGLEREFRHRPAGLRTNMFICFGAAMFTVLSAGLAGVPSDAARIAAQIIPGIGFIEAGSILHNRGLTTGLTTAATLFVVASVGMAAGGGLYVTAAFATGVVLLALFTLGYMERTFNLKTLLVCYEVTGASLEQISQEVNRILERQHRMMQNVVSASTDQHTRVQFDVSGCNRDQRTLLGELKASGLLGSVTSLGPVEVE